MLWKIINLNLSILVFTASFNIATSYAHDFDDLSLEPPADFSNPDFTPSAITDEQFKTNLKAVLNRLNLPEESEPENLTRVQEQFRRTSLPKWNQYANLIDPSHVVRKYIQADSNKLDITEFMTRIWKQFTFGLRSTSQDSVPLISRLHQVSKQTYDASPLRGLKILIDPGHMGGDTWDQLTGKYVQIGQQKVSEGDLNLWTSLLAAKKLQALGATVLLTRSQPKSVAVKQPNNFSPTPYIANFFYNSTDSWLKPILSQSQLPPESIAEEVQNHTETKRAFSKSRRGYWYLFGEDLDARSKMIETEKPDLVLVIHHDTFKNDQLQNRVNSVRAYIPGGWLGDEAGSFQHRMLAIEHLSAPNRFALNTRFAATVVQNIARHLNLPVRSSPENTGAVKVTNGVYARNLSLTRRTTQGLIAYIEAFHYDHQNEFAALSQMTEESEYLGIRFQHPKRVDQTAQGIAEGVQQFFRDSVAHSLMN